MTPTNAMITYVSKKFGVTYEDCKKTYEYLMKKKAN